MGSTKVEYNELLMGKLANCPLVGKWKGRQLDQIMSENPFLRNLRIRILYDVSSIF